MAVRLPSWLSTLGRRSSAKRAIHCSAAARIWQGLPKHQSFNQPKTSNDLHRAGGIATMMRLPYQEYDPRGLDVCFVGIPLDTGCSNRAGARHGPRAIREASTVARPVNIATGNSPFQYKNVGDIGDVPINSYNLLKSVVIITEFYKKIFDANPNCVPLTLGGDHTISLPILRAMREKYRTPLALIQVDAHPDLHDGMFGEKINHGTTFRRALDEDLISPEHMFQIGLRGACFPEEFRDEFEWAQNQGVRMVLAHECWYKSLEPLMKEIREKIGDRPLYFSFDIDGIDPSACPGTGTPEVGGLTPQQALEIVRGCRDLNLVGGDLVEVNPLFDHTGATASMGYNLLFEMLCVLPGVGKYKL